MTFPGRTTALQTLAPQNVDVFGTNTGAPHQLMIPTEDTAGAAAASPATEQDDIGERKMKRKISNRESARRSRARKQTHLDDLRALAARLRGERAELAARAHAARGYVAAVRLANAELRAEADVLSRRLEVAVRRALALNQLYAAAAGASTFEHTVASLIL